MGIVVVVVAAAAAAVVVVVVAVVVVVVVVTTEVVSYVFAKHSFSESILLACAALTLEAREVCVLKLKT